MKPDKTLRETAPTILFFFDVLLIAGGSLLIGAYTDPWIGLGIAAVAFGIK